MAIRHATEADRASVEALWDYCFEKRTDPFFGFYFGRCWRPEETLLYETDTGISAAVHLRRYRMSVRGVACPVTYIVGLATHPAARGRGYARRLVEAALVETEAEGAFANVLMPSAAEFYLPQGYAMYCHQWQRTCRTEAMVPVKTDCRYDWLTESSDTTGLARVYKRYTERFSGYVLRDESAWSRWLAGYLAEGHVVAVYAGNEPIAYTAYTVGEMLFAGETVWIDERGRQAVMSLFARHRDSANRVRYQAALAESDWLDWPDGAERTVTEQRTLPFMMVRPADRKWWSRIPTATSGMCRLAVTGADGTVRYYVLQATEEGTRFRETDACDAVRVTAADWTCVLIGRVTAAELAQRERLTGTQEEIALLTKMYPKMDTWINEWY